MSTKIKYKTRQSEPEHFYTEAGNKMANEYSITIDNNGHKTLEKSGETNAYEKIQLYLEETKIENIIERATLGETEALNVRYGNYIDTTDMPTSLAEAQNMIIKMKEDFDKLPLETRKEFDYSAEKFVNEYGTEKFYKAIGIEFKKTNEEITEIPDIKPEKAKEVEINE